MAEAYKQVVASKYSASALSYRLHHGVDDRETPMAVLVLKMIQPRFSGVLYTADPVGEDRETIRISAVHGLGDALVGGDASRNEAYRIAKPTFKVLEVAGADTRVPPQARAHPKRRFCGNCGNPPNFWKITFSAPWISNGR